MTNESERVSLSWKNWHVEPFGVNGSENDYEIEVAPIVS